MDYVWWGTDEGLSGRRGRSFEVVVRSKAECCRPGAMERLLEVGVCLGELGVAWVHCTVDHYT